MDIDIISYANVQSAITAAKNEWKETDQYNTHHHSYSEISSIVPGHNHATPDRSLCPGDFVHWISLIMASHHIPSGGWHVFELPLRVVKGILTAYNIWAITGRESASEIDDLLDDFLSVHTSAGISPNDIFASTTTRWFIRLDFCSTKDTPANDKFVSTASEVISHLCTSKRAVEALSNALARDQKTYRLFLVPFIEDMDTKREYRVFCPPGLNRITAISQYRWHAPFWITDRDDAKRHAEEVLKGASEIYQRLVEHASDKLPPEIYDQMITIQGFSFDVLETLSGEIRFIEVNPFGAMSGCGSCLFHWIKDAPLLYGAAEKVGFRIAM